MPSQYLIKEGPKKEEGQRPSTDRISPTFRDPVGASEKKLMTNNQDSVMPQDPGKTVSRSSNSPALTSDQRVPFEDKRISVSILILLYF